MLCNVMYVCMYVCMEMVPAGDTIGGGCRPPAGTIYICVGWGWVGWDINVLTTTSLILGCQHMFHQLGRRWWCNVMLRWQQGGVGWDINVLTTTSLILRCQHMFHQLGRRWWCNVMLRWQHGGVGWGGVAWGGILTSWRLRPWYCGVNTCW